MARTAGADRATPLSAIRRILAVGLALALIPALSARAADRSPDGQTIREVRIVGNVTLTADEIRDKAKIFSRAERPLNRATVDLDIKKLLDTKYFSDVSTTLTQPAQGDGVILTFNVVEMPILNKVEFIGRKSIKLKEIEESTGLKKGARADTVRARLAVQQIRQLYEDKGYEKAEVRLLKGDKADDREVVISIFEGPKFKVGQIEFVGNKFVDDGVLRTKLASRKPLFGLVAGHYEKDGFDDDARKLAEYYQGNGYLGVTVRPVVRAGADLGQRDVTFVIDEGKRYKVRNIILEGNRVLSSGALKASLKLHSGEFFSDAVQTADRKSIEGQYFSRGHIDARIMVEPKVTPQPDVVDLVYKIDEGDEYTIGQLIVVGNDRSRDKVIRREASMANVLPGERLDPSLVEKAKQRVMNTGYFNANPQQGKPVEFKIINRRPANKPFGDTPMADSNDLSSLMRLQNPDDDVPPALPPMDAPAPGSAPSVESAPFGSGRPFSPAPNTMPPMDVPPPPTNPPPSFNAPRGGRGMKPEMGTPGSQRNPAGDNTDPPNAQPGIGSGDLNGGINDRQEPFTAQKAYADVLASVNEAPTARFMAGVGASSFSGLYASLTVSENNFDITAIPRSLEDFRQGRAFRGGGQSLSLELSPGTLINRYVVSFRDPYLFNLPIGLNVSGYQFSRFYTDWNERRGGGRFSLGKQFGTKAYGDISFRIEDVDISGFRYPAPALLLDVAGHTTLASLRPSFKIDTRDSPFMANSGTFFETAYEQGWGTFNFGKATIEAREYLTVGSRPDGSGKRVLTFRGFFGVSGRETPIYERFFAGNLNSLRGFAYRGIGPFVLGVNTGGIMTALASAEYRFPWTANDQVQQVFFVDSGTVENDYQFTTYRVSVGTGVRIMIPQIFKQVPLAFDLAFPIVKGPADREQLFNFSIGAMW